MMPRCKCDRIELVALGGRTRVWLHEPTCPAYVEPPALTDDERFLANAGWIQRAGGWFYPDLDSGDTCIELADALRIEREWQAQCADRENTQPQHMTAWERLVLGVVILALGAGLLLIAAFSGNALGAARAHPAAVSHHQAVLVAALPAKTTPRAGGGRVAPPCASVSQCRHDLAWARKDRAHLHALLLHRDRENLHHAIAISSALFGVPQSAMTCIAWAESGYGAQTTPEPSSGALGPFQWLSTSWMTTPLGRAGYDRRDFLAASLTTAQRVVQDGGWREWVTAPGCGL